MVAIGPFAILLLIIVVGVVVAIANSASKSSSEAGPRGFPWISMVLAIVVLAGIVTFIIVQSRPITYVLDVTVPAGKGFIGEVIVDGRREIIEGVGSDSFEFTGKVIRWHVLIDDETPEAETISVQLTGGFGGSSSSNWGVSGFAEKWFLGGSGSFSAVSDVEWRTLMRELRPEENEAEDSLLPGFSAPSNPVDDEAETDVPAVPQEAGPSGSSAGATLGNLTETAA